MRINQTSNFLVELVREVAGGRMLPAAMQRPYVWSKADVEALCDSIISGFPIGGFLVWAPGRNADLTKLAKARLGPMLPSTEPRYAPYSLLLDGQNRLATLAWMMAVEQPAELPSPSEAETKTWLTDEKLVCDYATRSIRFVPAAEADVGLRVPAWTVVADSRLETFHDAMRMFRKNNSRWLQDYTQDEIDTFMEFWDRARDRFRDARTSTTIIEDATAAEARHAFLRICRVGVPMSEEDFNNAVAWADIQQ